MNIRLSITVISAAFVLVGLSACSRAHVEIDDATEPLVFETIGLGQKGFVADTLETVIRDSVLWAEMGKNLSPIAPFRTVDFSQEMVGLIAMRVESGGYAVDVETVEIVDDEIVVSYVVSEPDTDCITMMADALAFQAVTIRRADGDVRFERRNERYKCTF